MIVAKIRIINGKGVPLPTVLIRFVICDTDTTVARLLSFIESPVATDQIEKHQIICFDRMISISLHSQKAKNDK
jgi:hypothetical protein